MCEQVGLMGLFISVNGWGAYLGGGGTEVNGYGLGVWECVWRGVWLGVSKEFGHVGPIDIYRYKWHEPGGVTVFVG